MNNPVWIVDSRCGDKSHAGDGIYRMVGRCTNCHSDYIIGLFTRGYKTSNYGPCPICGAHFSMIWQRLATKGEIPSAIDPT